MEYYHKYNLYSKNLTVTQELVQLVFQTKS